MDLAWLVIVGIFLIACFATYGVFLNVEDAKRERAQHGAEAKAPAVATSTLSARLDAELEGARPADESDDVLVLLRLVTQELELARVCEARGQAAEARIHRDMAEAVNRELASEKERARRLA